MQRKVIIIDHRDSFTYNLAELFRRVNGERPDILSYDEIDRLVPGAYSHLVLSPGPGFPEDYRRSFDLVEAVAGKMPVLGICLGHQIISGLFGAGLRRMKRVVHGQDRLIQKENDSVLLKAVPELFHAGLYHSWVVGEEKFPTALRITARSEDGKIMAVEHEEYPVYGLQFHPESFLTPQGKVIIEQFMQTKADNGT